MSISRRRFIAGSAALGTALAIGSQSALAAESGPPNIVFIMADDLGFADLSFTGSHHIATPAIDSIGQNGVFLRQGYSNSAICSPTRTALLTGCYQYRFRVGLEEPQAYTDFGVPLDRPTLASVFRDLGYRTKLVGKWHLGAPPRHGPL
ncbi:MAG: sulfatase-like hydrolase/transferase, partial [Planctomycetaceae bacterium]|nr:sulfatase-like hydrolase/transferase [Planctomycetaceae bacterium]